MEYGLERPSKMYKGIVKIINQETGGKFEIELIAPSVEKLNEKMSDHIALVDDDDFTPEKKPGTAYRGV